MFKFKAKDLVSLPNILTYIRIILIFIFIYFFQQEMQYKSIYLGGILILSGLSDVLDGMIARKFNMVTEIGKCLDPIADKLTQFVLLLCLLGKYPMAWIVLGIFVTKEIVVTIVGFVVIHIQGRNEGAKWYGKLSTVIFYIVVIILVLFNQINIRLANVLLCISGIALIIAFFGYIRQYLVILLKKE